MALRISTSFSAADNFSHDWTDKNAGVLVDGSINSGRECEITAQWKGSENGPSGLIAASLTQGLSFAHFKVLTDLGDLVSYLE